MNKITILILVLLSGCKTNQTKLTEEIQEKDCSYYNDKFIEFSMANQKDSALHYIDLCVACAPKDLFFKTEKIKHHIRFNEISNAINYIETSQIDKNSEFLLLKGVLLLKSNNLEATNILEKSYGQLKQDTQTYSKDNSSLHFYKIGLDNFFQGKGFAEKQIEEYKNNYSSEHDLSLVKYLEKELKTSSRDDFLFKMFNIK